MQNKKNLQRLIASVVLLTQLASPLQALATDLADIPMAVQNRVSPNLMYTLDNSGSMAWGFMPDSVYNGINNNCYENSSYNGIYYNPNFTYLPGKDATGQQYPNASFTAAYVDGYATSYSYTPDGNSYFNSPVDLSSAFQAYFDNDNNSFDTQQPAYYYKYVGTSPATPVVGTCYSNRRYQAVIVGATSGPGGTDERTNFANWFSYYRTRILTMKTGLSRAFSTIDKSFRVGFSTINDNRGRLNNSGTNFIPINYFNSCALGAGCQKDIWYQNLLSIQPVGSTPLGEAIRKVGEYYATGKMPGVSPSTADPILYSCQHNYQIVSTDGFWNQGLSTSVGDNDQTVPTLPAPVPLDPIAGVALTAGQPFPAIFNEGPTATSDTLADVTMKYWITDLRPSATNNVLPNASDPATWQHMVTYTIGLGAPGTLTNDTTTYNNLKSGAINWPVPVSNDLTTIDDLWHAAVNGHGIYTSAKDPTALQAALGNALSDIIGRQGSGAAVAVSNPNVSTTDNSSFSSNYNSGTWTGDLQAYPISPTTGVINTAAPIWTTGAQAQLDALTWSGRYIGSYSGAAGVGFNTGSTGLTTAQRARLNSPVTPPGPSDASTVINFLRGDRSNETTLYRTRTHVLGDIINSEPAYVTVPNAGYPDAGYSSFASTNSTRQKMVYQGSNDGMLHAFNATTGAEAWAYVPGILVNAPYVTASTNPATNYPSTSALVNLSMKTGFTHLYYVDGTPVQGDVDLNYTSPLPSTPSPNWISLLVGGLNKGGRGYYALNVTNPAATSDASVASKVQWEFPNTSTASTVVPNIGYSYGKPILVKTTAAGWVVLVTSGYNNGTDTSGDGKGHLFVLNASTGALIQDISTGVGTAAAPSGLAQISAYVENASVDNTTDYVYGGDLLGNLWRFDLTGSSSSSWNVSLLATLVDGTTAANPQPITTAPELGKVNNKRMVYVGTGQYFGATDIPGSTGANANAAQTQTFYGLVDNQSSTPLISPLRSSLVQQTLSVSGSSATVTKSAADATKQGWYVDLPNSGERSTTDPALVLGAISFTTNIPSTDACAPGGSSWLYLLDAASGGYVANSTASWSGTFLGSVLSSRPVLVKLANGKIVAETKGSDGSSTSTVLPLPPSNQVGQRNAWREVIDN
ncbi:pilus assembly protein [Collimonas humicola]|uniref:pilus assembly protein n=1 Tax=Collimonas humicola TaxID=2825886 RepID=UPI002E767F05|nr:PilC/PilY family type IV pilus protein [Collimonas humicola]